MLSDSIREMRREFQNTLLDQGDYEIVISGADFQSYALALVMFEEAAVDMEEKLGSQPVLSNAPDSVVVPLRSKHPKRPQLHVVQVDGSGSDIA